MKLFHRLKNLFKSSESTYAPLAYDGAALCGSKAAEGNDCYFEKPDISISDSAILAFVCLRNERARLPYFLEYYRNLGVRNFFVVDNNSDDGSTDYLKRQSDVVYFWTDGSYKSSAAGRYWTHELANHYGPDHWCLTLDVDELLIYPGVESMDLISFTKYLDETGAEAMFGIFLDMYSDKPLSETIYKVGTPFLDTCQYFDAEGYDMKPQSSFPSPAVFGGPRRRQFWSDGNSGNGPAQRKHVLVKWKHGFSYHHSTHSMTDVALADVTSAVLHFKFFSSFADLAKSELERGDRVQTADYQAYTDKTKANDIEMYCDVSKKYESSRTLLKAGYLGISERYIQFLSKNTNAGWKSPRIDRLRKLSSSQAQISFNHLASVWPMAYGYNSSKQISNSHVLSQIEGAVSYINDLHMGGWIWDRNAPAKKFDIQVLQEDRLLTQVTADQNSVSAGNNLPTRADCGFQIPLSELEAAGSTNAPFNVCTTDGIALGTVSLRSSMSNDVKGAVDLFNPEKRSIRGWLYNAGATEIAVSASVYWDDMFLFDVKANKYQEFRVRTTNDPRIASHGFSFILPQSIFDGQQHELVLRVKDSNKLLLNCPAMIDTGTGEYAFNVDRKAA